jgi:hypothetical protein
VGVLSVPAQPGDAVTNNQKYAFQFGIPIGQAVTSFSLNSRLLGSPFFNGATGTQLGTQSVGIYFGNGDQDNYFKFVLHANNGNPGFQILCEQNGTVVNQQMVPIPNILLTSQVDLFIDVNAATGAVVCRYQTTSMANPVSVVPFIRKGSLEARRRNDRKPRVPFADDGLVNGADAGAGADMERSSREQIENAFVVHGRLLTGF